MILHIKKLFIDLYFKTKYYNFLYAFWDFLWWICFYTRPPFAYKISSLAINKKTKWLDKYIERNYADIIQRISNKCNINLLNNQKFKSNIWVFWGQGKAAMPPLIRACYDQLLKNNKDVILVTSTNVEDYIQLPEIIYRKVRDGRITWAHFSDIIRTTLLAKYGGLWLDATCWVSKEIPFEKFGKMPFYSANGLVSINSRSIRFWTSFKWNWSSWCMFSNAPNYNLFCFVSEMLQNIAMRECYWPDYVIQDYLIYYACRHFPQIGQDMESCKKYECKYRNQLASLMNQPYDTDVYNQLTEFDFVLKLSFRSRWKSKTKDGRQTFYGKLLSTIYNY